MNETIINFNYPDSLIKKYNKWVVLLRPKQVTLGSLILAYIPDVERLSDVSEDGFLEFGNIVKDIEKVLKDLFQYDKINYLTLMMVDKNVHVHVIPRYADSQTYLNKSYRDKGWPGIPDLSYSTSLNEEEQRLLLEKIKYDFVLLDS